MDRDDLEYWRNEAVLAKGRLEPWIRRTPLFASQALSSACGRPIYIKAENLQVSGSFKARPAFNSILSALDAARRLGVVTSSSGNFGAAVSCAAAALGVSATIVASVSAQSLKLQLIRQFGAKLVRCGEDYESRQATVDKLRAETGAVEIHPHSSVATIAGDATIGLEIADELPSVGTVVCPTSGGGLLAGVAIAMRLEKTQAKVIGVQSAGNPAMAHSFHDKERRSTASAETIADGLMATTPGELPFEIIKNAVADVLTVDDSEIVGGLRTIWSSERLVIEPSSAVVVAALSKLARDLPGPVVLVVSGANVDPERWLGFLRGPM